MEAELTDVKAKHGLLTRQYDEAVHKLNLAKQARERAHSEMERKEEEICALQVSKHAILRCACSARHARLSTTHGTPGTLLSILLK